MADKKKLQLVLDLLEAAQTTLGSCSPKEEAEEDGDEYDVDEQHHWDQLDEGMSYVKELLGAEAPYVVRVDRPFWATSENTSAEAVFFFAGMTQSTGMSLATLIRAGSIVEAHQFQTLAAAEIMAAQLAGSVMTFQEVVKELKRQAAKGSRHAKIMLIELDPTDGEPL